MSPMAGDGRAGRRIELGVPIEAQRQRPARL